MFNSFIIILKKFYLFLYCMFLAFSTVNAKGAIYTYGFDVQLTWKESIPANNAKTNVRKLPLTFLEDFSSEGYAANYWNVSVGSESRWNIYSFIGFPRPSMIYTSPGGTYQDIFTSPYLDATDADEVFLSFSLMPGFSCSGYTENDHFKVEVFDGTEWQTIHDFAPVLQYTLFKYYQFDISNVAANKQIRIRFNACGENSPNSTLLWGLDNINVFTPDNSVVVSAPLRLTAHKADDGTVHINWADPGNVATLSYSDTDEPILAIGNEGVPFIAGVKFDTQDLFGYFDYTMVSISAFIRNEGAPLPTLKLAVFQGGKRIVDQPIPSFEINSWNTFVLDDPIVFSQDITAPLYFGIEIVTHDASDFPLALGYGDDMNGNYPFLGRADLYSEDGGQTWGKLTEFGLFGSILIKANLVYDNNALPQERLMGYILYRDDENLLGMGPYGTSYTVNLNHWTDLDPPASDLTCYKVAAYYDMQQESEQIKYCLGQSNEFVIEATAKPAEGGNITGAGTYPIFATAELTAIPNTGYVFVNWTENEVEVSNKVSYSFIVTENRKLTANFKLGKNINETAKLVVQ